MGILGRVRYLTNRWLALWFVLFVGSLDAVTPRQIKVNQPRLTARCLFCIYDRRSLAVEPVFLFHISPYIRIADHCFRHKRTAMKLG